MRTVAERTSILRAGPWKLRESDPERMATVLHVALQVIDDAKTAHAVLRFVVPCTNARGPRLVGHAEDRDVDEEGAPSYRSSPHVRLIFPLESRLWPAPELASPPRCSRSSTILIDEE